MADMVILNAKVWTGNPAQPTAPFRSLLETGTRVVLGTDVPVEPIGPMLGLYAAAA